MILSDSLIGRLQPPPVFYQPNYGDSGDLQGERTVTIGSPLETEYADIEETIRVFHFSKQKNTSKLILDVKGITGFTSV